MMPNFLKQVYLHTLGPIVSHVLQLRHRITSPTLPRRIPVAVGLMLIVAALLGTLAFTVILRQQLVKQLDQELAGAVAFGIATDGQAPLEVERSNSGNFSAEELSRLQQDQPGNLLVVLRKGTVVRAQLVRGFSVTTMEPAITGKVVVMAGNSPTDFESSDIGDYRVLARSQGELTVIVGRSYAPGQDLLAGFFSTAIWVALLGSVFAAFVVRFLVKRAVRPLGRVTDTAHEISVANLLIHVPKPLGPVGVPGSEAAALGAAFDKMLDNFSATLSQRARNESQMRQFVADASYELSAPLAQIMYHSQRISGTSEDERNSLDVIRSSCKQMSELLADLLLLAHLDHGRPLGKAPVDLASLVTQATEEVRKSYLDHPITLDFDTQVKLAPVIGDHEKLNQAVVNLITNACQHTNIGTPVTVRICPASASISVHVIDAGTGITPGMEEAIFERFTRGDAARGAGGSTGLGLAVVGAIARAHGGSVTLAQRGEWESGAEFILTIPTAK